MDIDFSKGNGLVPAILQHYQTKQVLMMGYMNEEAFEKTKTEKVAWFYSRSKKRLWKKGETSKHTQRVVEIKTDCDKDTLLLLVDPNGPTCHLGSQSCFGDDYFNLSILEKTVQDKIDYPKEGSYTTYLTGEGLDKILKKCSEEMSEVVIGAKNKDRNELINETSDLLYHLLVLLRYQGVSLAEIEDELKRRHGEEQVYSLRKEIKEW